MSTFKYYKNGQWNVVSGEIVGDTLPIGSMVPYGSTTAPTNWLICDGSAVSRTTYSELFAVIGTSYGSGDGSTTFNLPNYKGRVPVGYDSSQTEFDVMGETGGTKTVTLNTNQIPAHHHDGIRWAGINGQPISFNAGSGGVLPSLSSWNGAQNTSPISTNNAGGGQAHNNLQPYQVSCFIIKAKQSAGLIGNVTNTRSSSQEDAYGCEYVNNLENRLTPTDSGWQNCTKSASALTTRYFVARKINDQVFVDAQFTNPNSTAIPKGTIIGTVPSGFAPTHEIWVTCRPIGAEGSVGFVYFSTNGNITYYGSSTINTGINFNAVFLID